MKYFYFNGNEAGCSIYQVPFCLYYVYCKTPRVLVNACTLSWLSFSTVHLLHLFVFEVQCNWFQYHIDNTKKIYNCSAVRKRYVS